MKKIFFGITALVLFVGYTFAYDGGKKKGKKEKPKTECTKSCTKDCKDKKQ